jgi:hypothetical protein
MSDIDLYNDVRMHDTEEEALEDFQRTKQWLIDYAGRPEKEDGSFEGREFGVEQREHKEEKHGELTGNVWRITGVLDEVFKGEVQMKKLEFEGDVPIILGVEDIKQIRIVTKDETE